MAADPDEPYIRMLREHPPQHCPICEHKAPFLNPNDLQHHMTTCHQGTNLNTSAAGDKFIKFNEDQVIFNAARQKGSLDDPAWAGSTRSNEIERHSINASAGGSRSPSPREGSSGEDSQKLKSSTKRPWGEAVSPSRYSKGSHKRSPPTPSAALERPPNAPPGLLPEVVSPKFKGRTVGLDNQGSQLLPSGGLAKPKNQPDSRISRTKLVAATGNLRNAGPDRPLLDAPARPGDGDRSATSRSNQRGSLTPKVNPAWPSLVLQPVSREISQEQLAAEVKSIYTGLTMVETKCIHVDKAQQAAPRSDGKIKDEHWQAMIALHRTLLHEHHDFFLASQHPSASPALKRLALKYSMPARMWKHGIHSFLELLRHRLPESLEYMLAWIILAYQMMALLYETVGTFRNTWIECLGDLGRYRMAVEDEDVRDREIWAGVARSWYNKAGDNNPAIGRLWHHLAILARPHMVQQLYLYTRSLTSIVPFTNARESIATILDPVLAENVAKLQASQVDILFVRIHAHLFKKVDLSSVRGITKSYLGALGTTIKQLGPRWRETGSFACIANVGAMLDYGSEQSRIRFLLDRHRKQIQLRDPTTVISGLTEDQTVQDVHLIPSPDSASQNAFDLALELFVSTVDTALSIRGDENVVPLIHTSLVFLSRIYELYAANYENEIETLRVVLDSFPWHNLSSFLNNAIQTNGNVDLMFSERILFEEGGAPLSEDWMLRGSCWTFEYFPKTWFDRAAETEEEERYRELTSTVKARMNRVLSLAAHIAKIGSHITFHKDTMSFTASDGDVEMDEGYGSLVGDDSPEMQRYTRQERDPESKMTSDEYASILGRDYSAIIADVDVLKDATLFPELLKIPLRMIIPEQAMLELQREREYRSQEATKALERVEIARHDHPHKVCIEGFGDNEVQAPFQEIPSLRIAPLHRVKTMNDAIERIARRESGFSVESNETPNTSLSSNASTTSYSTKATVTERPDVALAFKPETVQRKKPLLISDNKMLRAKADHFGAAAMAGYVIKKWLHQTRKHSLSGSGSFIADNVRNAMDLDPQRPTNDPFG